MDLVTNFSQSPYVSMADNPINMFDPWGADPEGGGGGATSAPSSESSSSPSSNSSDGSSGSSSGGSSSGKSGGGISPKSINKDPDKFKEGERLFSGPFETDLMFHDGLFYHEQKYRSLVQDLVDSYGDGKAFDEKLSTFANENGFSENFIEIYAEQGRETYGGNEKIGDLGLKNPFINFGLESNDFDVIAIASVFGLAKNGIKYFLSRSAGSEVVAKGINWEFISGIVRDAAKGKGNFSLGKVSFDDALEAGKVWVGDGYIIASDGKTLVSANGLRQFRPPSFKHRLGKIQANFEWRNINKGRWQGNGHLDIIKP